MPLYPPRSEPVKKAELLSQKEFELRIVIQKNFATGKLNKAAEKYRAAQLSYLKAKMHVVKEKEFQNKTSNIKLEKLVAEIESWTSKTAEEIINEIRKSISK
jgi:hypothetical protein